MKLEGPETGADDYLAKPFNARELLARSKNLITLRQQEKEVKQLNQQLEQKLKDQLEELVRNKKLSGYFSGKLLNQILTADNAIDLATERRNITILFCDHGVYRGRSRHKFSEPNRNILYTGQDKSELSGLSVNKRCV